MKAHLMELGHPVADFGAHDDQPSDYPDYILPAADAVARGACDLGIVLGGSGNGEAIAANKVRGIRCAVCWSVEIARLSRRHNDANMIALAGRFLAAPEAAAIVDAWLSESYEGGRHANRLAKVSQYESASHSHPQAPP
ncbi:MAG TPA: RpiB/LacA/LacB family sugar-phosphate isomerase [Verrucomicrobiales bacterium]|nr:RpiB/LacA/LacB family sugar-phosphate isomerase [Verrucomicrobiales bacterium]